MNANDIERAERLSRGRAAIMALAALVLVVNLVLQFGNPAYVSADPRGGSWLVVIGLWLFILWNGGGLRLKANMRALLNDELSLQNRARALSTGFYVAVLGALVLYGLEWRIAIGAGDALKLVSAGALAAALLRYAWLEWR
jgi:protein-S-isoprenylcysteine O-methyltransferase Ste14